ncbi:hypothetical protein ACIOKD_20320 [Streptomyces sp. NPDC087844]|uniref:hypothetical protein n=1 Tax=Streptomyces sp. NPDC087844 TaxID=3365805 RepID=UPI00380C5D6E
MNAYADLELTSTDALELLIKAASPQITAVLARHRPHNRRAKAAMSQTALREQHLGLPEPVAAAYAATTTAHAKLLISTSRTPGEPQVRILTF